MQPEVRAWTVPSPLGELLVATTQNGVCLVEWAVTAVARRRLEAVGTVVPDPDPSVTAAFDAYFDGAVDALSAVSVDLCLVAGEFRIRVLDELRRLGSGRLTTYGALAHAVAKPGAAQAVGQAVGANPVPIIVPCHRVIGSDGSLGGFSGGLSNKRVLLAHEGFADLPGGWARPGDRADDTQLVLDV